VGGKSRIIILTRWNSYEMYSREEKVERNLLVILGTPQREHRNTPLRAAKNYLFPTS
jgi:hypothetical protein